MSALAETNRPNLICQKLKQNLLRISLNIPQPMLFMIGELSAVLLMTALITILFLEGGYHLYPFTRWLFLDAKQNVVVFFIFSLIKGLVPRYRYDQLMRLGWKLCSQCH